MRDPFQGYDQWKTASPFDDEPDILEELANAIEIVERSQKEPIHNSDRDRVLAILRAAAEFIEENI